MLRTNIILLLVVCASGGGFYRYPKARQVLGEASRSQDWEDLALFEQFFSDTYYGKFVEIGAHDGRTLSNTYAFEKIMNWTGVLIEANP